MRVAIVNDLRLATEALRRVVCSDPRHEIAWTAADGEEAVRLCGQDTPDVILMDLLMPVMNGAEAIRQIMQRCPCAVLVVTATVAGNFALVYEALGHGAYDAVCTPELGDRPAAEAGAELLKKLASVDKINRHLKRLPGLAGANAGKVEQSARRVPAAVVSGQVPIVAIGASTGGPAALAAILSQWPKEFPAAVVVVQHIGVEFAEPLVQWLGDRSKLKVRLASPGDHLQRGTVLVAGTNDHLVMIADRSLRYTPEPADYPYRPSVDALFRSLAAHWSAPGVAALLTGIGRDGAEGLLQLRKSGWNTIAQDDASSVVYGMPKEARDIGAAAAILPLSAVAGHISDQVRHLSSSKP
jgi:two-component system response regulator WspF